MMKGLKPTPITDRVFACLEGVVPPENPFKRVREEFGCTYMTAKKLAFCLGYRATEEQLAAILEERGILKN